MVKAKDKYFYIFVRFDGVFKPITKTIRSSFECNENEKPKRFTESIANDILLGLNCNCYEAFIMQINFCELQDYFTVDFVTE